MLIVVLWRGGLRIQEALALSEPDLDPRRGSLLVRNGKGGRRRENIIQRQFGHANLETTSIYLQGIDTEEIIVAVHSRRPPMMPPSPACASETPNAALGGDIRRHPRLQYATAHGHASERQRRPHKLQCVCSSDPALSGQLPCALAWRRSRRQRRA